MPGGYSHGGIHCAQADHAFTDIAQVVICPLAAFAHLFWHQVAMQALEGNGRHHGWQGAAGYQLWRQRHDGPVARKHVGVGMAAGLLQHGLQAQQGSIGSGLRLGAPGGSVSRLHGGLQQGAIYQGRRGGALGQIVPATGGGLGQVIKGGVGHGGF